LSLQISNKFFGQVPASIDYEKTTCDFPNLRILALASNNFSGILTEEWFIRLKSMIIKADNQTLVMEHNGDQSKVYEVNTMLTYKGSDITFSKILKIIVYIEVCCLPNPTGEQRRAT
jgi:hypothetical protein